MKGREGKFYIQKCYDINWDRWEWYATCWMGDEWRIFKFQHTLLFPMYLITY